MAKRCTACRSVDIEATRTLPESRPDFWCGPCAANVNRAIDGRIRALEGSRPRPIAAEPPTLFPMGA